MPKRQGRPLHSDPDLYARYGLDPRADAAVVRSLAAFAEHKRWPRHKLEELLAWEQAVRPLGLSPHEYKGRALAELAASGWSDDDLDALDAWHGGVARHGPDKAWPLGWGDSPPAQEARMGLTAEQRTRKQSIEAMMRHDRRAYFADHVAQNEYRALVQADPIPVQRLAAETASEKFTRDVRRYMRSNRDDYFRDERLQSTYRAALEHNATHAEPASAANVAVPMSATE
jgi:Spy/CpxP family protein refolding chaperone